MAGISSFVFVLIYSLLSFLPQGDSLPRQVDEIEINHVYDKCGQHQFTQAILWAWYGGHKREVVAWKIVRRRSEFPIRYRSGWLIQWGDVTVFADHLSPSWTQHDPELEQRKELPVSERRGVK